MPRLGHWPQLRSGQRWRYPCLSFAAPHQGTIGIQRIGNVLEPKRCHDDVVCAACQCLRARGNGPIREGRRAFDSRPPRIDGKQPIGKRAKVGAILGAPPLPPQVLFALRLP